MDHQYVLVNQYVLGYSFKGKKDTTKTNVFQKVLNESGCKPNKTWIDKGSKFYIRLMKLWLQDNDTKMYSTHNEGESVVAERLEPWKTKLTNI